MRNRFINSQGGCGLQSGSPEATAARSVDETTSANRLLDQQDVGLYLQHCERARRFPSGSQAPTAHEIATGRCWKASCRESANLLARQLERLTIRGVSQAEKCQHKADPP